MGNYTWSRVLESNKDAAQKFLLSGAAPFSLPGFESQEGIRVMKSVTNAEIQFIVLDENIPKTILAVQQKNDAEIAGLMDMTIFSPHDMPHGVTVKHGIFSCLKAVLSSYPIRVYGVSMKKQGFVSWTMIASWAISRGFYVYAIENETDLEKSDSTQIKQHIPSLDDLSKKYQHLFNSGYGIDKKFNIIISQKALN